MSWYAVTGREFQEELKKKGLSYSKIHQGIEHKRGIQGSRPLECVNVKDLTDTILVAGAYGVPSNSQIPTVLGQGGPTSTQWSHPITFCPWCPPFG